MGRDGRTHRVKHDVAGELLQMAVLLDENRLVPPLEEMADVAMAAIEALGVDPVQLAHPPREFEQRGSPPG